MSYEDKDSEIESILEECESGRKINGVPITALCPVFVAGWDYKEGGVLEDNPYSEDSIKYIAYRDTMAERWNEELTELRA